MAFGRKRRLTGDGFPVGECRRSPGGGPIPLPGALRPWPRSVPGRDTGHSVPGRHPDGTRSRLWPTFPRGRIQVEFRGRSRPAPNSDGGTFRRPDSDCVDFHRGRPRRTKSFGRRGVIQQGLSYEVGLSVYLPTHPASQPSNVPSARSHRTPGSDLGHTTRDSLGKLSTPAGPVRQCGHRPVTAHHRLEQQEHRLERQEPCRWVRACRRVTPPREGHSPPNV